MEVTQEYIDELTRTGKEYLLVCATPVSHPLSCFVHTYVIVVSHGEAHRYEVFRRWGEPMPVDGCVYKDLFLPWEGNARFVGVAARLLGSSRFGVTLLAQFEDVKIHTIETNYLMYPFRQKYRYWGPNSNTFTSWLLVQVGIDANLPFRAWGKYR